MRNSFHWLELIFGFWVIGGLYDLPYNLWFKLNGIEEKE